MTAISYHHTVNELQTACQQRSSPFDRFEWFEMLANHGLDPLIAVAREGDARVALALTSANRRIEAMRNWYSFVWRPHAGPTSLDDRLMRELARDLKRRTHRVTLWPLPDEDLSASRLAGAFQSAGWRVTLKACDTNHILNLNGRSFTDYWSARPGKMRTTLKRKSKNFRIDIVTEFKEDIWRSYEEIYIQSWKPEEGNPRLLRDFAQREADAGRLRMGIALQENLAVAAQFWTVEAKTAFIHKLAHLESHRQLSPGTVLSAAMFEYAIDKDRVDLIDFGTGNDRYKSDWMEDVRPRYRLDCLDPAQMRGQIALLRNKIGRLARPIRQG